MKKFLVAIAATVSLSACGGGDGDPFNTNPDPDPTPTPSTREMPPGTENPTPNSDILRREPRNTGDRLGDGYAQSVTYNADTDVFTVDNIAFDGNNSYTRDSDVPNLGPFAVYEAPPTEPDRFDGALINQYGHRAIYGESTSGNTRFAIVRTGNYLNYGFGGFVYQRDGGVTLPTTGQAAYRGTLAGIRDPNGAGDLQYTTADVNIQIDFDDFNDSTGSRGDAVRGVINNRRIFDSRTGADITQSVLAAHGAGLTAIPGAAFSVGPGVIDDNGEILGEISSSYTDADGNVVAFETGNYYAIVSGDNADEIVGVVVLESTLPIDGVAARETGGFIVYN
ncbi:hypothetical protein [Falsiruegeria litorea]|uniref:Transferrin-binding protein B C-lobe/N-lobe beta barrel domain-containing protein n=1 Tax=Falsiruegeria litorea TaxID=1280831 RepID=A0ABS5X0N3_9RHOB|nr:hypothetical protein [Falsiruegeria litorea]MBT3143620.1 hypothetical protein [Falsiruegeria litorea]MBT8167890.1 hypothetical protein [Falsiruegeria litorea]